MAYLTNSIGAYSFAQLSGPIFYRQQQLEIIERHGVTGSGVRRLGSRGRPFDLTSVLYCADFAAAKTAMQAYDDLPGTNPVTLTRNGIDHGTYLVLQVVELASEAVLTACGNAVPGSACKLIAGWTLLG